MLSGSNDHFIPDMSLYIYRYKFIGACNRGDEDEVKRLYDQNPAIHNQQDFDGWTGLMVSLANKHHSVSRWLLGRPGIDTFQTTSYYGTTALHIASWSGAPLDIVAQLAELARRQGTLNHGTRSGTEGLTGL